MEYLKIKKKFNLREKLLLSSIIFIFFIFFYYIGILKYYIPAVHLNSQIERARHHASQRSGYQSQVHSHRPAG